jgi:hypothetical protein
LLSCFLWRPRLKENPTRPNASLPGNDNREGHDQCRPHECTAKRLQAPLLQTQFHLAFRAGDLTNIVSLPENILKAIAWAFNRANLNAEERETVFQVTDPVL